MTEAMPFLQKYDITFLRPPTITGRVSLIFLRRANGTSASFMLIMMWENLAFFQQFCSVCMDLKTAIISKISSM